MASILNTSAHTQCVGVPKLAHCSLWRLHRLACIALVATVLFLTTISLNTPFASTDNWAGVTPTTHAVIADAACGGIVAGCH
jgi:hypothetical protein